MLLNRGSVLLLVFMSILSAGSVAFSMDVSDVTQEWTVEGKALAAERVKLPAYDEMVRIPAGPFTMSYNFV